MTDPTRYKLGVRNYARGQARAQAMGLRFSQDDPGVWEQKAHDFGMGNAAGISARHRQAGPPLVSQEEFSDALHKTFAEEKAAYTPERVQSASDYMHKQAKPGGSYG